MREKNEQDSVPNVSGSFQIVTDEQQKALKKLEKEDTLDEKSLYYARIFMED
ncbi:hypothetical protein QR721_01300 [Aciduricibacillus chroicocephali]|uniref:YfhE family protein n=1 Tax=Aciduricibacillus chroicocephali TaxID=3054939 RepID=A0ABY9KWC0_9BACI|nr:hypothetical protein QR721_01300 [Bacillaceae bacterium 44XB]